MIHFIMQTFIAYIATITAGILVEAPKALLYKIGVIGAVGYSIYLLILPHTNTVISTLLSCMTIAILSQIFARLFKAPVTIFYIPSIFTLVPGAAIYQTAFYFINGNNALMSHYFTQALLTAGAIALGVFLVESMLEIYYNMKQRH